MKAKLNVALAAWVILGAPWISGWAQGPAWTNLSTRAEVEAGVPFVSTFSVAYGREKTLLVRAVGPSLSSFGLTGTLAAPKLEIYDSEGMKVAENDDLDVGAAAAAASVGALPLVPDARDAVLIKGFAEGKYIVRVTGVGGTAGTVLLEIYDLGSANNRITSFTSYSQIGVTHGFVLSGLTVSPGSGARRMLFRAVGIPSRTADGKEGTKVDPRIEIYSGTNKIAENDDWSTPLNSDGIDVPALSAIFRESGASPLEVASGDAALVLDLFPGIYTLRAVSTFNLEGGVLVEAYEVR